MIPLVYASQEPGTLIVRGYGPISVWSWDDGFLYDSANLTSDGAGAVAAGTELVYFRDIQNKTYQQTNMSLTSQLPSGWEMIVLQIGIHIPDNPVDNTDSSTIATSVAMARQVLEYGYAEFVLDNSAVIASGPVSRFACPWGLSGHLDFASNAIGAIATHQNGTPIQSAVPYLQIPIFISDSRTFRGTIHLYDALAGCPASATMKIHMVLHGFMKSPAM